MGKIKQRVYPRDITINIGKGAPIPEHPYQGQRWKEVRQTASGGGAVPRALMPDVRCVCS